jgi:hypothetical protein
MRIERLEKFEPINEANTLEKIKNWFSRNFGGSVKKIEGLLSDYKSKEMDYVSEWKEILRDIEDLEISVETSGDAAEERSSKRTIDRKKDLLASIKNKHRKEIEVIFSRVKSEVKGKKDLEEYWGNRKAEVDADIAKKMYEIAKDFSDESVRKDFYDKYKRALVNSEKAIKEFSKMYKEEGSRSSKMSSSDLDEYVTMTLKQFSEKIKDLGPVEAGQIAKFISNLKSDLYVELDVKMEKMKEDAEKFKGDKSLMSTAKSKMDKVRNDYMERIRQLRTKYTLIKKYT